MKTLANIILIAVQWLLILAGVLTLYLTAKLHGWSTQLPALPDRARDSFVLPVVERVAVGVSVGLCAIGLGAALFYLRHLFVLGQRPPR